MTNERVIFLDMDGVLCTPRACLAHGQKGLNRYLDPIGIDFLNRFTKASNSMIVVSSTWRTLFDDFAFKTLMATAGYTGRYKKDWKTPDFFKQTNSGLWMAPGDGKATRPIEIQEWLNNHLEVGEYLIFDDDSFEWNEKQTKRWIHTDTYNGITHQNMIDACQKWNISIEDL